MLTASEIRRKYIDFFERRKHAAAKSGPLVPEGDPSLLFTNAGMVQFKDYFLGDPNKPFSRAVTCQKCLRVSGKHNDLENVGRTARHHTFFEMLGNFSFGDYFKKDAIAWAWEFVTSELGLPKDRLWVTIYKDDDEAANIWKEVAGLPDERIVRMGEKDNFWTMGDTGPCGPCSEIYIDQGEEMACGPDCGIGKCDCDRFLEIWNLVFTQYDQQKDGQRLPLAAPNIDTGMGLERIAAVCQGRKSNFDCDLFQDIIQYAAGLAHVQYSASAPDTNDTDTALRVIADHGRAAAFLVAEGILPSNESRGYVLRRLIRRALRFAKLMNVHEPFLHKVAARVAEVMGDAYPELLENAAFIERVVLEEERRFALTLDNGLHLLEDELERQEKAGSRTVPGEVAFRLYDTYGFPLDIVTDVAGKRGFSVDGAAYEKLMEEQRARARASQKKSGLFGQGAPEALKNVCESLLAEGIRTVFVGYDSLSAESAIAALVDAAGNRVEMLGEGQKGYLAAFETPFYGESGGQAGDRGRLCSSGGRAAVLGAVKPVPEIILHEIEVEAGEFSPGQKISLEVNGGERMAIARNHTCTHLLHAALRRVLGQHVRQSGSLVDANRLRFDFSHLSALSPDELARVERQVNEAIMADLPVTPCEMSKDKAVERGAMALFTEKYGEKVRVLTIGDENAPESMELCGGTHLSHTGQAGSFYITSEGGVAAGVRRIEAVTGWNAYGAAIHNRSALLESARMLKAAPDQLREKIMALREEVKKLRKTSGQGGGAGASAADLAATAKKIGDINVIATAVPETSMKRLREIMDELRGRVSSNAVMALASPENGKLSLLAHVSKDLHSRVKAPDLVRIMTDVCGGGGGGRPDLAQAGGGDPARAEAALEALKNHIAGIKKDS